MFLRIFLLLFICLPLLELYVLIHIGSKFGGFTTIALCVFTAIAGGFIVREQGISTLLSAQRDIKQGLAPASQILHGFLLVIAGISLFIPGFISDAIGFLLLFPFIRSFMIFWLFPTKKRTQATQETQAHFANNVTDDAVNKTSKIIDAEIIHEEKIK